MTVDYPPGAKSGPHSHAKSAFIYGYVVSGAIRSQVDDEPARLLAVFVVDATETTLTTPDRR